MQCDGVHFLGFQFSGLHTRLLKFIYHVQGGLFQVQDDVNPAILYINRYIFKIEDAHRESPSSSAMKPWLIWVWNLLKKVLQILSLYNRHSIKSYRMEDKIRVTFLAWELVLLHLHLLTDPSLVSYSAPSIPPSSLACTFHRS